MTAEEPLGELSASEGHVTDAQTLKEEVQLSNPEATEKPPLHQPPASDKTQEADPTSTESDEPFCRICHEGPGSCLEHWLTASNSSHCELCQHHYSLERQPKPFSEWWCASSMQQQRRTLFGDVLCFLFITPLSSLSGWLCVQGAMDLYYTNAAEALGLMLLTVSLFTIYVFWSIVRQNLCLSSSTAQLRPLQEKALNHRHLALDTTCDRGQS
uniref:RING-CH-type domain-containing protein n=1 Tax=Neogobius melanostomus TaxID=47308 RepID=A0A8C6SBX0_9GOBI